MRLEEVPDSKEQAATNLEQFASKVRDGTVKRYYVVSLEEDSQTAGAYIRYFSQDETSTSEDLTFIGAMRIAELAASQPFVVASDDGQ